MRTDTTMRLAVTPAGHDDIGPILLQLGSGYPFQRLQWKDLERSSSLDEIDVLFANCEGTCSTNDEMNAVAPPVRGWIERGG